jgi:hypothetical protein
MWSLAFAVPSADESSQLLSKVFPWLLVLIGVILVGGVVLMLIRRNLSSETTSPSTGFTLHDLRTLHDAGEISDEEFDRAKKMMIGRVQAAAVAAKTRPESEDAGSQTGNNEQSSN